MKWAKERCADDRGCGSNRTGSDITRRFLFLILLRDAGVILPRSLVETYDGDQRVRLEQISGDDVAKKVRKKRDVDDAVADAVADAASDATFLSPRTATTSPLRFLTPSPDRIPLTLS